MNFTSLSSSCKQIVNSLNKGYSSSISSIHLINEYAFVSCTKSKPLVTILSILRVRNYISSFSAQTNRTFTISPNIFLANYLFRFGNRLKGRMGYSAFHFSQDFISSKKFKKIYLLGKISRNAICVTSAGIFFATDVYRTNQSVRILINPNF